MKHYYAVMARVSQDQSHLAQAQRKLSVAGAPLPDEIRAAQDKLNNQRRTLSLTMRSRDYATAEQNLHDMEDTLAVIEKFMEK